MKQEPSDDYACADLLLAAESSLDFWDNPLDDEDWNDSSSNGTSPPCFEGGEVGVETARSGFDSG